MGGDFLANLKGLALPARKEHGVTFAPEIKTEAYRLFEKSKWEAIGILLIISNKEEKQ